MSIYIEDGKTVKHYCTNKKTDKAIITLIEQIEDMVGSESREGCKIVVMSKEEYERR